MSAPSRSSIHEANRHLQALYQQVDSLTAAIHDRNELLELKELQRQQNIIDITNVKDSQIVDLQTKLDASSLKNVSLEKSCDEKQKVIDELRMKEKMLDQIISFQPSLEKLVYLMSMNTISSDSGLSFGESTPKPDVYTNTSMRRIAHYHQRRKKTFSISEDDGDITDSEGETSEEKGKGKEVYF